MEGFVGDGRAELLQIFDGRLGWRVQELLKLIDSLKPAATKRFLVWTYSVLGNYLHERASRFQSVVLGELQAEQHAMIDGECETSSALIAGGSYKS